MSGFTEKLPRLLESLLFEITNFKLKEKKFEIAKEWVRSDLRLKSEEEAIFFLRNSTMILSFSALLLFVPYFPAYSSIH